MKLIIGTANLENVYGAYSNILKYDEFETIVNYEVNNTDFAIDVSPDYGVAERICNEVVNYDAEIYSKRRFKKESQEFVSSLLRGNFSRIELIHNWEELNWFERELALKLLSKHKETQKWLNCGFSTYEQLCKPELLQEYGSICIQAPINILNQKNIQNLKEVKKNFPETSIVARSIFLQGALIRIDSIAPSKLHSDLERLKTTCSRLQISPLRVCVEFIMNQEFIDGVVVGVNNFQEWLEIKECIEGPRLTNMNDADWESFASRDNNLIDPRKWS
jgi:aryl-alcohol dehydrogenase-like predicted oxidoreductase